jgi:hypothetical protein
MTDFVCPNCRGGFPEPEKLGECPWCGQAINGEYEPPTPEMVTTKVRESRDTDNGPGLYGEPGVLGKFFGWGPDDD